jgi:hypothetical protein
MQALPKLWGFSVYQGDGYALYEASCLLGVHQEYWCRNSIPVAECIICGRYVEKYGFR